jgi:hypothetical protein
LGKIVDFLNQSKAEELKSALDELDDKIREILKGKDVHIDDFIVETLGVHRQKTQKIKKIFERDIKA